MNDCQDSAETFELHYNPPGLRRLSYRLGTYNTFLQHMLQSTPNIAFPVGGQLQQPLKSLNRQSQEDFAVALLSCWALVADVLCFYQERIANEGYVGTATQPQSLVDLAGAVGCVRRPAVAAQTYLAFTVQAAPGQPGTVAIGRGPATAVQSAPPQGEMPAVFETDEAIQAQVAWNTLKIHIKTEPQPQLLRNGGTEIYLSGLSTGLHAGSPLLLQTAVLETESQRLFWHFRKIASVELNRNSGYTKVAWKLPLAIGPRDSPQHLMVAFTFGQEAGLFGQRAPDWTTVPDTVKNQLGTRQGGLLELQSANTAQGARQVWRAQNGGLPTTEIRALTSDSAGNIFAATADGVFCLPLDPAEGEQAWTLLPTSVAQQDTHCVFWDARGYLYAGTVRGGVFVSADGGDTWQALARVFQPGPSTSTASSSASQPSGTSPQPNTAVANSSSSPPTMLAAVVRSIVVDYSQGPPCIYIGTDKGVLRMLETGLQWQPWNSGFPNSDSNTGLAAVVVYDLVLDGNGNIYAGTNMGLFRSNIDANSWSLIPFWTLPPQDVVAILVIALILFPSQASAIFLRWLINVATPHAYSFYIVADGSRLLAGTSMGLFVSNDNGATWHLRNFDDTGISTAPEVRSLAASGASRIAAGTSGQGIFLSEDGGTTWLHLNTQEIDICLVDSLFAANLDDGHFPEFMRRIIAKNGYQIALDVTVSIIQAGTEWQAQSGEQIFLIRKVDGQLQVSTLIGLTSQDVAAVTGTPGGQMFAAAAFGPVMEQQWPGFQIELGAVALNQVIQDVEPGSLMVLSQESPQPLVGVYPVESASIDPESRFSQEKIVTRVQTADDGKLGVFDLRQTSAYLKSSSLEVFVPQVPIFQPCQGSQLELQGLLGQLPQGRHISIAGQAPAAVIVGDTAPSGSILHRSLLFQVPITYSDALDQAEIDDGLQELFATAGVVLTSAAQVTIVARGQKWIVRDEDNVWLIRSDDLQLSVLETNLLEVKAYSQNLENGSESWVFQDALGQEGRLSAPKGDAVWLSAVTTSATLAEVVRIKEVMPMGMEDATRLALAAPLQNLYDPATATICANVARASQGETITSDVLGSGNASLGHQQFALAGSPLSYRHRDDEFLAASLRIQIIGGDGSSLPLQMLRPGARKAEHVQVWRPTESLDTAGSSSRVYVVSIDEHDRTRVTFGDGIHGARLPTGRENVIASYRSSPGNGNVSDGKLIALRKRPAGVRSVTNPVAARGGEPIETIESMQNRLPRTAKYCDRIVSLQDYADFACAHPGVGNAKVTLLEKGPGLSGPCLTVSTQNGQPIEDDQETLTSLRTAIQKNRAGSGPFYIKGFDLAYFNVEAKLMTVSGGDAQAIESAVREALLLSFSSLSPRFCQNVSASEVIVVMQGVPGVVAVDLLSLHRPEFPPTIMSPLIALLPQWPAELREIRRAEFLVVNPTGIKLNAGAQS